MGLISFNRRYIMLIDLLSEVKKNPIYNFITDVDVLNYEVTNGLERIYTFNRPPNYTNFFKEYPGMNNDIKHIDYNKYLELYPDYEFLYGPYVDSNADEFNIVYVLHRKQHTLNNIKVIYASRLLKELTANSQLENELQAESIEWYQEQISKLPVINPEGYRVYNTHYKLSEQEKLEIKRIYGASSVSNPKYNAIRNLYNLSIIVPGEERSLCANLGRILYEIHIAKRRLKSNEVVSVKNGKMGDLRLDNLICIDKDNEYNEMKKKVFEEYGLDVDKLEKIYSTEGFGRFRGIYTDNGKRSTNANYGRKYIKLVKPGTDIQLTLLLSTALMTVDIGRILSSKETVDHINRDKTDDKIENLSLLQRSTHCSEDAVRVEILPTNCGVCNKLFVMSAKKLSYYKSSGGLMCCTPKCTKKLQELRRTGRTDKLYPQVIDYRYYVLNKTTREREYFESKDYKECRRQLNTTNRNS